MSRKTRKLIWSAPLVAVLAVAGALAMFVATAPNPAQAHDPPGVPGDVTATTIEENAAIKVSWSKPTMGGDPTGYRIDRSKGDQAGNEWFTLVPNTGNTMTSYRDPDVERGETYYYRVFAINSAGIGPVAKDDFAVVADPGAPGAPQQLNATAMGQNKIVLTWHPSAKTGGKPIDKYRIFVWSDGGTPSETGVPASEPAANATDTAPTALTDGIVEVDHDSEMAMQSYEHSKAKAGTRYLYRVLAINEVPLSSAQSDSEDAETDALTKPKAPTELRAVQSADDTILLYWSAPVDTGGADITGYRVQVATKATGASFTAYTDAAGAYVGATLLHDGTYTISGSPEQVGFRVYSQTGDSTANPSTLLESDIYASVTITVLTGDTRTKQIHTAPLQPSGDTVNTAPVATRDAFKNVKVTWGAPASLAGATGPTTVSGYMIDVSDDGISWSRLQRSTGKTSNQYLYVDTEVKARHYRVFAWNGRQLGPAATTGASTPPPGATIVEPSAVRNLTATPNGPTQIDLSWDAPSNLGNAPIKRYNIQARMAGGATADPPAYANWPAANAASGTTDATDAVGPIVVVHTKDGQTTTYSHKKLKAGQTWEYRVLAVNQNIADPPAELVSATGAVVKSAKTTQESKPKKPEGLTAEDAKDSSNDDSSARGVLLQWNAPNPPDGAALGGYRVERKVNNGDWETLEDDTGNKATDYTDEDEPEADESRAYRVAAISENDVMGDWSDTVYYPYSAMAHDPGMPTGVMAEKDAAMPTSQIKVSWSAPASGVADGYIIERRYGDMMAIPSDGYSGTDGANRSHAFKNYKEWWETLNCKGMLAVAGSSADPAVDSDDKAMYCKHFANTAPTNMAFEGSTVSEPTAMKIKDLFMKRYVANADGTTKTMFTGMMHTDMNLMANTQYTYRVRAIHGMTAGPWSTADSATTDSASTALTEPTDVEACVGGGGEDPGSDCNDLPTNSVKITWTDGDNADRHLVALFDSNWNVNTNRFSNLETDGEANFENVPSGAYNAVVFSIKDDDDGNAEDFKFGIEPVTVP